MTATLKDLKASRSLTGVEQFWPGLQDDLGYALLVRRGYAAFMQGGSLTAFGLALAKEWASFPVLADTQGAHRHVARGQSFYAGDGLNKALVKPEAVEQALGALRGAPATQVPASISAPRVETATPAAAPPPWWQRLLGLKPKAVERPGLKQNGSLALWDVQKALKDRAYYRKTLDGLDGGETQEAVAQARKDNGLGDGGVDAAFLAALPGFPHRPVSADRARAGVGTVAKEAPLVFDPLKILGGLSLGSTGVGLAGASGLIDQLQAAAAKVNDVGGSVQTAFGALGSVVGFVAEHRWIVLVVAGLYGASWVAGKVLKGVILFRQALL